MGVSSIAKKGATIILLAECADELGAEGLETLAQVDTLSELRRRYMLGARAVHLIKSVLRRNEVILVSALPGYLAEPLGLSVERTASDAFEKVTAYTGEATPTDVGKSAVLALRAAMEEYNLDRRTLTISKQTPADHRW